MASVTAIHLSGARARLGVNVGFMMLALVLLAVLAPLTGQIEARGGRGWDGGDYAAMLEEGLDGGTANTALRPLIVVLNTPAFLALGDAISAFRFMNYAYVGLLCLAICLLLDLYRADVAVKALVVFNVLLSIATLKFISFYPVLIDAGAYAVLTLAMCCIVAERRRLAAVACLAAVVSREFGVALLVFGVVRDLRLRAPLRTIALTYAPAAVLFLGWRFAVAARWAENGKGGDMLTMERLTVNLLHWQDPMFVAFFLYFLATVFGGVSLFVLAKFGLVVRHLRREPEWSLFAAVILAAAATGSADLWRYLAYLLPAVVVLFAVAARDIGVPRRRVALAGIVCAATVLTQRPLQAMSIPLYFRDWFPYYVHLGTAPPEASTPDLWPLWGWRFLAAAGWLWVLASFPAPAEMNPDAHGV